MTRPNNSHQPPPHHMVRGFVRVWKWKTRIQGLSDGINEDEDGWMDCGWVDGKYIRQENPLDVGQAECKHNFGCTE